MNGNEENYVSDIIVLENQMVEEPNASMMFDSKKDVFIIL